MLIKLDFDSVIPPNLTLTPILAGLTGVPPALGEVYFEKVILIITGATFDQIEIRKRCS